METYYNKEALEKIIKNEIPEEMRNVIIDVLIYLNKNGVDIEKQIERINKADFIIANGDRIEYEYELNGKTKKIVIDKKNNKGFYKPIIVYDKINKKFKFIKELVVVKKNKKEEDIRGGIIHELMHLLSSKTDIEESGEKAYHYSGIARYIYEMENGKLMTKYYEGEICITEAITEVIRYYLMKEIYKVPYTVPYRLDENGNRFYNFNAYYMITNLMNILNLGITRTTEIDELLDVYLNNKRDIFYSKIENLYGMSKEQVRNVFYAVKLFTIDIFRKNMSQADLSLAMNSDILPIYKDILYKFYNDLLVKNNTEERKKTLSTYLDGVENYLAVYFQYPIFNYIKEDLLNYVNLIRQTYN